MASSARIEELERKFNENPRRYFAPLANEYRKAGDLEQAIAICRTYVPQQPAHMSGHIVFGQALFEAGEHEEARGVFEAALALDPENLIALRHLGDIARERGEMSAARTWYQRVLDADPRNDEVATLLTGLNGPAGREAPGDVPTWAEINPERTLELPPGLLESVTRETVVTASAPDAANAAPSGARAFPPSLQPPPPAVPAAGWAQETAVVPEDIPGPRLVDIEPITMPADKPPEPSEPAPVRAAAAEPPAASPSMASEMTPAASDAPVWGEVDANPHETIQTAPADGLEPMEFVAPPHPEVPPTPPTQRIGDARADDETPAVFVTETMAELYLQQGFRDEALNVYRQLLAQNPADVTLRERVEHLEQMPQPREVSPVGAGQTVTEAGLPGGLASSPTIRAFFAVLATRKWHGGDNGAAPPVPETDAGPVEVPSAPAASLEDGSPSHMEPQGEGRGDAHPAMHLISEEVEVVEAAARTESPPEEVGGADRSMDLAAPDESTAASLSPGPSRAPDFQITHDVGMEPIDGASAPVSARVMDDFEYAGGTAVGVGGSSEYDVASYDEADMSGTMALAPRPAISEPVPETEAPPAVESEPAPSSQSVPSPAPMSPAAPGEPAVERTSAEPGDPNGTGPANAVRRPMQTGSVNVLFPPEGVRPTDETAAATLSSAFGGPTQAGGPSATGRPARPASSELSLDSIFREAPPPAEPRREASAFSFDQFFTDATGPTSGSNPAAPIPGAAAPRDGAPDPAGSDSVSDAEQFSNWLAGLKKK